MRTVKIFISQPMNGKTNEEIESKRKKISEIFSLLPLEGEIKVLDSFFKDAPHDANGVWYLGESIKKLSEADVAIFAEGWENARGCKIERMICKEYGIPVYEEKSIDETGSCFSFFCGV